MKAFRDARNCLLMVCALGAFQSHASSVTHYEEQHVLDMTPTSRNAKTIKQNKINVDILPIERHKRLQPYINYYQAINKPVPVPQQYSPRYNILLQKHGGFQLYAQKPKPSNENARQRLQQVIKNNKIKVTPFLESNALPGPFIPLTNNEIQTKNIIYTQTSDQTQQEPHYSYLYDQLSKLKLVQDTESSLGSPTGIHTNEHLNNVVPNRIRPNNHKTFINTYIPSNIDISNTDGYYNGGKQIASSTEYYDAPNQKQYIQRPTIATYGTHLQKQRIQYVEPFIHQGIAVDIPAFSYPSRSEQEKENQHRKYPLKHLFVEQTTSVVPVEQQKGTEFLSSAILESNRPMLQKPPVIYIQRRPTMNREPVTVTVKEDYEHRNYVPENGNQFNIGQSTKSNISLIQLYQANETPQLAQKLIYEATSPSKEDESHGNENYEIQRNNPAQNYIQKVPQQQIKYDQHYEPHAPAEDTQALGQILKDLQDSHIFPYTLTRDNVDNSIKTLINILAVLERQKPVNNNAAVGETVPTQFQNREHPERVVNVYSEKKLAGAVAQGHTVHPNNEGTSGRPGIDYPALSTIPPTRFNCRKQRYKGFFGDPDTNCQVWHYCDLNGGQASFLCPNGTIFSQVALTCDWWYNVKCSTTTQLYVLNERLYKYILPLSPKFPEDYSGPLVDKYLALKFQEMEEKLRRNKNKGNKTSVEEKNTEQMEPQNDTDRKVEETIDSNEDLAEKRNNN